MKIICNFQWVYLYFSSRCLLFLCGRIVIQKRERMINRKALSIINLFLLRILFLKRSIIYEYKKELVNYDLLNNHTKIEISLCLDNDHLGQITHTVNFRILININQYNTYIHSKHFGTSRICDGDREEIKRRKLEGEQNRCTAWSLVKQGRSFIDSRIYAPLTFMPYYTQRNEKEIHSRELDKRNSLTFLPTTIRGAVIALVNFDK